VHAQNERSRGKGAGSDREPPAVHEALSQYYIGEWKSPDWEREHRRALELDPNFANAHPWFGGDFATLYRYQGHYDLWLDALKKNAMLNDRQKDLALVAEVQPIYKQPGYKPAVHRIIELYKNAESIPISMPASSPRSMRSLATRTSHLNSCERLIRKTRMK